jgi:ribonucleoside-diphosphate reductase alpha chain
MGTTTENKPVNGLEEIARFVFTTKYARYNEKNKRRETWDETIGRVESMHLQKFKHLSVEDKKLISEAFDYVRAKKVVPSMRSMQFGGKAVFAHNARLFNCAVRHVDSVRSFSEIFYLLLCGCGVGIGLSKTFLDRLPDLVTAADKTGTVVTYTVQDTIEGWADSVEVLLNCYTRNNALSGRKIVFDYSKIRPEGAKIKTGGGKAPGYRGLKSAHKKIKDFLDHLIEKQEHARLRSVDAYDILMHCSDAVLSGGIRRSATSVIFMKEDEDMLNAKTNFAITKHSKFHKEDNGQYSGKVIVNKKEYEVTVSEWEYQNTITKDMMIGWHHIEPQRARSNNSILLLRNQTTLEDFRKIIERTRQYGEPGFVFADHPQQLLNPCFEISFVPVTEDGVCGVQFCNLTSINGAKVKTKQDFIEASRAASLIGTLQAAYTDFKYLSNAAKKLTDDEALLGVSITGMMDNPSVLLDPDCQNLASAAAVETNRVWADKIGIKQAARVTCIKPEGTSSLVLESASGIHPHHSRKYFRRVQMNKIDNVYQFFKMYNSHMCEPSVWSANKTDDVVCFPIEVSPEAIVKGDLSAKQHLEYIK